MRMDRAASGGFTLIELMVVVAIVAFLLVVALPAYQDQVLKTRRNVGKGGLMEVAGRQEQFFVNNKQYAADLTNLGFVDGADGFEIDNEGEPVTDGDADSIYLITLSLVTTTTYQLTATPRHGQTDDTRCGKLTLNEAGEKGADGDVDQCW